MNKGPIVIVEDDVDDCDMIRHALSAQGIRNEFRCFETAVAAFTYLESTEEKPLLIISDINMPYMTGIEFKKRINEDERVSKKLIPFVFLTTAGDNYTVQRAFELCAQGYFMKPHNGEGLNRVARSIVDYWQTSRLLQVNISS